jgi:hypothetical protein
LRKPKAEVTREMEGVGFDGDDVVGGEFFYAEREHLVGEVDR